MELIILYAIFQSTALAKMSELPTCGIPSCLCDTPGVLDCGKQNLKEFNVGSSFNVTGIRILKLNNNELSGIPDLSVFTEIHTLDLSHNKITSISPRSFQFVPQLLYLDISNNSLVLSNATVTPESFHALKNLKILKMKQEVEPAAGFDYSALEPLHDVLEELYITGTGSFSTMFKYFTKLHTLSLGGSACKIPSLNKTNMESISRLSLERFSARNCNITEIDRQFLHSFNRTLRKLDLSCNHLKDFFAEITNGVSGSSLNALILDHINKREGSSCEWTDISDTDVAPLSSAPLKILSVQANHFGIQSTLNFRKHCAGLLYLDLSQNDFGNTAFYIDHVVKDQVLPEADEHLFHTMKMQPPSLRYFGLQSLTRKLTCGENPDLRLLNCDRDSYLFLENKYYWDENYDPEIMDFQLLSKLSYVLEEILSTESHCIDVKKFISLAEYYPKGNYNYNTLMFACRYLLSSSTPYCDNVENFYSKFIHLAKYLNEDHASENVDFQLLLQLANMLEKICSDPHNVDIIVSSYIFLTRSLNASYASDNAINTTIHRIWKQFAEPHFSNLVQYTSSVKYLPTNCTTIALGYNNLGKGFSIGAKHPFCSDIAMYGNNLQTLDLSHSIWGFIPCLHISGLKHLTNLTCKNCGISGWHKDLFSDFPLKYLDLTGAKMASRLRTDMTGETFGSAPGLTHLFLGKQEDGVKYFADVNFLSHFSNLSHLDLHENKIVHWNISISSNSKLKYINLRDNRISYMKQEIRDEIDAQHQVSELQMNLMDNDVFCHNQRSELDYIRWLLHSPAVPNADRLICSGADKTPIVEYYQQMVEKPSTLKNTQEKISTPQAAIIIIACAVTLATLIILAVGYANRYRLIYRWYKYAGKSVTSSSRAPQQAAYSVFASHTNSFTEKLIKLINEIEDSKAKLKSRELHILPGHMTRAATAKLIAESSRVAVFVTPDYMREEMTRFEFALLKQKGASNMVVITVGIDTPAQLEHLPTLITDVIVQEKHIVWPVGLCAGGTSDFHAFVQTLLRKVASP